MLATVLTDRCFITAFDQDTTREVIVAGMQLAKVKCGPLLNLEVIDGLTHSKPVSVVLFNSLFKSVVSCGLDSLIIIWDLLTGTRLMIIKQAHTKNIYGEQQLASIQINIYF